MSPYAPLVATAASEAAVTYGERSGVPLMSPYAPLVATAASEADLA